MLSQPYRRHLLGFIMFLWLWPADFALAQATVTKASQIASEAKLTEEITELPDAPGAALPAGSAGQSAVGSRTVPPIRFIMAPKYAQVIEPDYQATPQTVKRKLAYSVSEIVDGKYLAGVILAASLSQGFQADPLYGDSKEAFAQRVGSAGARQASQFVFADGVLAPVLREDTRYYVLGPKHSVTKRISYAISQVFLARTDGGRSTPNFATLGGYAGASALTQLYYPVRSRDINTILSGYGLSLGGKAVANEVSEFCRFLVRGQPKY